MLPSWKKLTWDDVGKPAAQRAKGGEGQQNPENQSPKTHEEPPPHRRRRWSLSKNGLSQNGYGGREREE